MANPMHIQMVQEYLSGVGDDPEETTVAIAMEYMRAVYDIRGLVLGTGGFFTDSLERALNEGPILGEALGTWSGQELGPSATMREAVSSFSRTAYDIIERRMFLRGI